MIPDFQIRVDPGFWPELTLQQRIRCALTLAQRASERFYGVSFMVAGYQPTPTLANADTELLRASVEGYLQDEADKIWKELSPEN